MAHIGGMATWVLFVLVVYGPDYEPRAITSVPGFRSEVECTIAGGEAGKRFKEPSIIQVMTWCAPGPEK